jgi:5S rRNA maturation endonuclease (ribonuclease M5)
MMARKETIIGRFQGNPQGFYERYLELKRDKEGFRAKCPFHDGKSSGSLSINEKGLFKCFGCDAKGDFFTFAGLKYGLDVRRDFKEILEHICRDHGIDDNHRGQGGHAGHPVGHPDGGGEHLRQEHGGDGNDLGEPVAVYRYTDARGELLFEVCRYANPKTFRQRQPRKDGKGYLKTVKGVEQVLYHLPEAIKSREIWIPEGEKDVENLVALGYVATCNPGGAGKWQDSYSEALRGKDVIVLPDNDKAGEDHARKVCRSLHGKAKSIKVIRLPGLPEHGDVSDFIQRIGREQAAERLALLAEATKPWQPIDDNPLSVQCIDDLLTEEIPDNWLVEGLISEEECGFIAGGPKWGKSILGQNLSICLAAGHKFLNTFPIVHPVKVLYVNAEISRKNFQRRFQAMKDNAGFTYPRENLIHLTRKGFKLDNPENFKAFEEQIAYHRPQVVILDCLYMIVRMSLDKHDTTAVFLDNISSIIQKYHCTVIIIHHYRKPSVERAQKAGAEEMIGSFALHGYGDFYLTFKQNHNNRREITLDFELRNAEEPQKLRILRNPETLWYELMGTVEQPGRERKGSIEDVTDILADGDMSRPEILAALCQKLGVKNRCAEDILINAHDAGKIVLRNPGGRPVIYGLRGL